MLRDYVKNSSQGYNLQVLEIFSLKRDGEDKKFNPDKLDNRKLLFHGSSFSNFVGILTNGMRIAPPEAPCSGYNFGKGVYTADMAGKSANYCRTYQSGGVGLFVMCEVALGRQYEVTVPNHQPCPKEYDSTKCDGQVMPDPSGTKVLKGGLEVPMGKTIKNPKGGYMGVNEYIVYDTKQVRLPYLIKFKM